MQSDAPVFHRHIGKRQLQAACDIGIGQLEVIAEALEGLKGARLRVACARSARGAVENPSVPGSLR